MTNRYWDRALMSLIWKLKELGISFQAIPSPDYGIEFQKDGKQLRVVMSYQQNNRTKKMYIHLYKPNKKGEMVKYAISNRKKLFRECGLE